MIFGLRFGRERQDRHRCRGRSDRPGRPCYHLRIMQILAGEMALKQGRSLDDVKDAMLDIHLAAMQKLMDDQAERKLWDE